MAVCVRKSLFLILISRNLIVINDVFAMADIRFMDFFLFRSLFSVHESFIWLPSQPIST